MKSGNIDELLGNLRYIHLNEKELEQYQAGSLGDIARARADAHLKRCLICAQRLEFLQEDAEAIAQTPVTAADLDLMRNLLHKQDEHSLLERLWNALQQIETSLVLALTPQKLTPVRALGKPAGQVSNRRIWQGESKDGLVRGECLLSEEGALTFRFISDEPVLQGKKFYLVLSEKRYAGMFTPVAGIRMQAEFNIPRKQIPAKLAFAIEWDEESSVP